MRLEGKESYDICVYVKRRFVKRRRFVRGGKSIDASGENKYRSQSNDFTEAATGITGTRAKERAKARKKRTREGCLA